MADQCAAQYLENRCDLRDRPALVKLCEGWKICMSQVPVQSAITLNALSKQMATLINTFSGELSHKSLVVLAILLAVVILTHRRQPTVVFPKSDFSVAVQDKSKALALKSA